MNRLRTYIRFLAVKRSIKFLSNNLLNRSDNEGNILLTEAYRDYQFLFAELYYGKKPKDE